MPDSAPKADATTFLQLLDQLTGMIERIDFGNMPNMARLLPLEQYLAQRGATDRESPEAQRLIDEWFKLNREDEAHRQARRPNPIEHLPLLREMCRRVSEIAEGLGWGRPISIDDAPPPPVGGFILRSLRILLPPPNRDGVEVLLFQESKVPWQWGRWRGAGAQRVRRSFQLDDLQRRWQVTVA
jgi:hypothetical protein